MENWPAECPMADPSGLEDIAKAKAVRLADVQDQQQWELSALVDGAPVKVGASFVTESLPAFRDKHPRMFSAETTAARFRQAAECLLLVDQDTKG